MKNVDFTDFFNVFLSGATIGVLFFFLPYSDEVGTGRTGLPQQAA